MNPSTTYPASLLSCSWPRSVQVFKSEGLSSFRKPSARCWRDCRRSWYKDEDRIPGSPLSLERDGVGVSRGFSPRMILCRLSPVIAVSFIVLSCIAMGIAPGAEDWTQVKFDAHRSGDAADRSIAGPLGLLACVPLSDAVFTAPVVAGGKAFVVDGSGVVWAIDVKDFHVVWRFATPGGPANCNNVASPAIAGRYLHVGTMAGGYYVLDASTGALVKEIRCGEPIFSAPVLGHDRVCSATLGSKAYALESDGRVAWTWDYVVERLKFRGDRWSGSEWRRLKGQVTWRDQFCCVRDLALHCRTLVMPAGGAVVWLEDAGDRAVQQGIYLGRRESPATLGLALDSSGTVYRQWTQRDNNGSVEVLRWKDGKLETGFVAGTETGYDKPGLLSFSSVSLRGGIGAGSGGDPCCHRDRQGPLRPRPVSQRLSLGQTVRPNPQHAHRGLPLHAVHVVQAVPDRPEFRSFRRFRIAQAGFVRAAVRRADVRGGVRLQRTPVSNDQRRGASGFHGRDR